ncbi:uncharacterized protein LOC118430599 [Branchiostoma floridae]|uniref:Uncharacterized protein LOC118430599 n=1 Tax=Branchiostoma floridae TaxID=7739 RepID=C3XPH6_BRAFL|nr:uncharacterized protein LOC118430599 [Branchiostoma floridae]|eukprot:XP_002613838.1 hypothetical protein BRAFLDRAFT_72040 [Branchiostoma floridae]
MVPSQAILLLLLIFSVDKAASQCPYSCHPNDPGQGLVFICHCPNEHGEEAPCSWVGHGGAVYSFGICLDAIPTGFYEETRVIYIQHLRSSRLLERSFPNISSLQHLRIQRSNISTIQPGAFRGLPLLQRIYLDDNRLTSLGPDAFLGLDGLKQLCLTKNMISAISKFAFYGLPVLTTLQLLQNRLTSVPINALLQPKALMMADLAQNAITTIYSDVLHLTQHKHLKLVMQANKLKCDQDLKWFICNLPILDQIQDRFFLRCAFPHNLEGTLISSMSNNQVACQTNQQGAGSKTRNIMANTTVVAKSYGFIAGSKLDVTGPQTVNAHLYNHTTEDHTSLPFTNAMIPVSQDTTVTEGYYVIILGGDPTNKGDGTQNMSNALVAVLLFLLATVVAFFAYKSCPGRGLDCHDISDDEETDNHQVEPYAVIYADMAELEGSNSATEVQPSPTCDQTSDNIQPDAVAGGPGPQLQPHAVTCNDNARHSKEIGYKIEPYATGYPGDHDLPEAAEIHIEADSTPLENSADQQVSNTGIKQPVILSEDCDQSIVEDANIQLGCEDQEVRDGNHSSIRTTDPVPQPHPHLMTGSDDQQETIIKQPLITESDGQPQPNDDELQPTYENEFEEAGKCNQSIRNKRGPNNTNEIPSENGMLDRSGSQHTGSKERSLSCVLYNPAHGQPECKDDTSNVLYNPIDG